MVLLQPLVQIRFAADEIEIALHRIVMAEGDFDVMFAELTVDFGTRLETFNREGLRRDVAELVASGASIDSQNGQGSWNCGFGGNLICLRLHNGGVIFYDSTETYGGTADTNAISFMVDPDGTYCGGDWCAGKGVWFWVYANGRIVTSETLLPNTANSNGAHSQHWAEDSPWFSWD